MDLKDHLKLRTPLVWAVCDEAPRVLDRLVETEGRAVFRIDPLEGLCRWGDRGWKKVLIEENGQLRATNDLGESLTLVGKERGTLVLTEAHKTAEHLTALFASLSERYRDAVREDDERLAPAQVVLVSHDTKVPAEVRRSCPTVDVGLPDVDELKTLIVRLGRAAGIDDPGGDDLVRLGRAAAGMSESEATTAVLDCIRRLGRVEALELSRAKLAVLKAGGLLEVRSPSAGLDSIGGLDRAKELITGIAHLWSHPGEMTDLGIEPLRRLLMVGLPGTGKSLLAETAAAALGIDLAKGGVSNVMNKFVGESEANMRKLWQQVKALAPIVFWVDEFGRDMSGGSSSAEVDGGVTDRVHGEFLSGLQELPEDIFLIGAANRIDHLPPEMTRADRFDKVMFIGFPTQEEREDIFRIHLGERHQEHNLAKLAGVTNRFTGAEIKALVREVRFETAVREQRRPLDDDFIAAAPDVRGRVWVRHKRDVVSMYSRALEEWDWASSAQEAEATEVVMAAKAKC